MQEQIVETKQCKSCGITFDISQQDKDFLEKLSPIIGDQKYQLPIPDTCPDCRQQRRTAFRNRRNLYKRKCDLTGRPIVSMYSIDKPFKVYYNKNYENDFDAIKHGRNFDFSRSFFEQMKELQLEVPRFHSAVLTDTMENAEYVNGSHGTKNSYLAFSITEGEDIYYSEGVYRCKDCVDCYHIHDCELCYECIETSKMYKSRWCNYCTDCSYCDFCKNCENCQNCFGCINQVGKKYCIFNKQYSKEEYEEKMKNIRFSYTNIETLKTQFKEFNLRYPHKHSRFINIENSIGDDLINAKNAYNCFGCEDVEDVRYCYFVNEAKNCMDILYYGTNLEKSYRSCSAGSNSQNIYFCSDCYESVSNLYYCDNCVNNVKNCFGCVGLKNKEYCVLNKQYTKEEYEYLVPKIIKKMKTDGERGAFFPPKYSPFGYNESFAMEHFPLSKEEATKKGFNWMDAEYNIDVPKNFEADPEIINCEVTGKPFRITKQELNFYEKMGLPLPTKNPNQRHKERFEQVNKKKLWNNKCDKCGIEIQTTYSPEKKEIVYCQSCYDKEIYG